MEQLVFFATYWGTEHGDINSFNFDLCRSIAKLVTKEMHQVVCVVLKADNTSIAQAKQADVELISLDIEKPNFEIAYAYQVKVILHKKSFDHVAWWIGQDVFSGPIALELRRIHDDYSSRVALVHHIDFGAYKGQDLHDAQSKIEQQKILKEADAVFGVGPYLQKSAKDLCGKPVTALIPGLIENVETTESPSLFNVITLGSLDLFNDMIKQLALSLKALGKAYGHYSKLNDTAERPKMSVCGISEDSDEFKKLLSVAEESDYAHIPINAFPHKEKRQEVWSYMRRHNLCLMPSLHGGFGLAGWEAIGLEVPLILSKHSGLFQLLYDLNAESYVQAVDITGITEQDIEPLSQCISKVYFNKQKYKDKAAALKKYLLDKEYTWETTARNFLEAIEISPGMSEVSLNNSHPYFQARPADLGMSFDTLIFERTRNFIGREFVFKSLDTFLAEKTLESGYFIIKGEPGIGKSALMAYLVKNRGYIHHFNIALQSINKPRQFLKNICAQLIARYKLDHPKWPPDAEKDGAFLNQLLWEASEKLKHGDKLVIAIDALDEADITEQPSRANVFFLPPNLPSNVFFIITTRPRHDIQLDVLNQQVLELDAESDDNLQDARTYIKFHLRNKQMQERIAIWNVTPEQFTKKIQKKSEGNFMYLYHVLPAIQKGDFIRGGLDELPEGLLAYYQSHWRQMRSRDESTFEQFYQPIVCVLATVKEAVTIEQVSAFTGLPLSKIRNVIREWREFLYEEISKERKKLYRVYHTTFQEFLKDEVDPGLKTYHKMIAGYYLKLAGHRIIDVNSKSKTDEESL